MSHFPDEVWADWARGIALPNVGATIREHMAAGCTECAVALETWQAVADVARRDFAYEPPASVLESAFALYEQFRPPVDRTERPTRFAELVFDSFRSPLPEGVRSLERATRHLSYKAGSFFIDVRIEEPGVSGLASVVGQLMHHPDASALSLEGCVIVLSSGRATLAETTTNRFGEFAFEMDTQQENHLAIGVGEEFAVVVPLSSRGDQD